MPDAGRWTPEVASTLVADGVRRLLSGGDLAPWSDDVVRAVLADRAFLQQWRRSFDELPDAWRQQWAAFGLAANRVKAFTTRRYWEASDRELNVFGGEPWRAAKGAKRKVSRLHLVRATDPPRPPFRPITGNRSLLDGFRVGGRPSDYCPSAIGVRVEVWADIHQRLQPERGRRDGRLSFDQALAETLLHDLELTDRSKAKAIHDKRRWFQEVEGFRPLRALIEAVKRVDGRFNSLRVLCRAARRPVRKTHVAAARAHAGAVRARRSA